MHLSRKTGYIKLMKKIVKQGIWEIIKGLDTNMTGGGCRWKRVKKNSNQVQQPRQVNKGDQEELIIAVQDRKECRGVF